MHEQDFALNNPQGLMCNKTKPNPQIYTRTKQTKMHINIHTQIYTYTNTETCTWKNTHTNTHLSMYILF